MPTNAQFKEATPDNIRELVKKAGDRTNWRGRLEAVEELGKWKCQQSKDVLWRLCVNDLVFAVKEAAFRKLQAFGEDVYLGKKKKGNLIPEVGKKLQRVRDSLMDRFSFEDFKAKFAEMYPEAFDVYDYEKSGKFDEWLQNMLTTLPKKK